ncbi:hypothetical protein [Pseudomonas sp. TE3610]
MIYSFEYCFLSFFSGAAWYAKQVRQALWEGILNRGYFSEVARLLRFDDSGTFGNEGFVIHRREDEGIFEGSLQPA